jgi:ABC-type phosphate transport system substrate-binding protein
MIDMNKQRALQVCILSMCAIASINYSLANTTCTSDKSRSTAVTVYADPSLKQLITNALDKAPCNITSLSSKSFFQSDSLAIGALMFNKADVAILRRPYTPLELAPYAHQYSGDMMKSPLLVNIGSYEDTPLIASFNKRPDTAVQKNIELFINFLLSKDGQIALSQSNQFIANSNSSLEIERKKLDAYHIKLDPSIQPYKLSLLSKGYINSVGSDGMKSLMDQWMSDFISLQPNIRRGDRWEHLGTLNGYHALLNNQTDIAPMGRELWPEELNAFQKARPNTKIVEIKVAHGGYNTQQRTTTQGIFVNEKNPIQFINLDDLQKIWMNPPQITNWGELGLEGDWKNKPINLYSPPLSTPNARSLQGAILNWDSFNRNITSSSVSKTSEKIAEDINAMGFGGFEDIGLNANIKSVPVAAFKISNPVAASGDTVANRTYPLNRYMYIRFATPNGSTINPAVKEFLKYILSKSAQEKIIYSGYYPLTNKEIDIELQKLK